MNISCIFSIVKEICFFTSFIILVLLVVKVVKSNKDTKNGKGTTEEQQLNVHYRIALREMAKKIFIEILVSIFTVILYFNITNINFKQIIDFLKVNNITLHSLIIFLISVFILINEIIFNKQVKDASYYLFYDEFYKQDEYVIISTGKPNKTYNFSKIYQRLDQDKCYHEYLLECSKNNYNLIKLLSPIPILSLIINIAATYFETIDINTSFLTIIVITMVFAYIIFAIMINRKIKKIKFDLWRNNDCRIEVENMEKEFLKNNLK